MNKQWNPNTKPYCISCRFYEAKGFYTWEIKEKADNRKCKHLQRCFRVSELASKNDKQISMTDFIGG